MKKIIAIVFLFPLLITAQAQITSTFDTDADGWNFLNASNVSLPGTFQSTNGNPGGYVSATYASNQNGSYQQWFAPDKFKGSHLVRSHGMNLRFDLQQSQAGAAASGTGDVRIENGSNVIIFTLPAKPAVAPAWTSYTIKLDETSDWRWSAPGGAAATRQQIMGILTNVTSLEIRGTYATNAAYTSGLDNVILEQRVLQTAPSITSFSQSSAEPGTTITLNGNNFDPTPSNNVVYFGPVSAAINNASATQLSVIVPAGANYGRVTIINKTTGLVNQSTQPFNPVFPKGGRIIRASFAPKVDLALDPTAGNDVNGLTCADMDGDGWSDIIVAEAALNDISIFRNLAQAGTITASSFAPKVSFDGAGNSGGIQITDLDGDGKLDIVASNTASSNCRFATFRNTSTPGNLAFEPVEIWSGLTYSGFTSRVIDLDGDGRAELIGQHGSSSVFIDFWIAQNISTPGNIEFGNSVDFTFGNTIDAGAGVGAGDLDNDGKPELLVSDAFGSRFHILKNNSTPGSILLSQTGIINTGQYNNSLQVADFNLDGKNDLIWRMTGGSIRIRLNVNAGTPLSVDDFPTEIVLTSDLGSGGGMTINDINGDGKPDLVTSDNTDVGVYENNYSGGVFDASAFVPAYDVQGSGSSATTAFACDLNNDTKPDLIFGATPTRLSIFENKNIHAPAIAVNTVSPLTGAVGSTITITGNDFSTTLTDNKVKIGAVDATVLTATETELTVRVPAGAGYGFVSVTKSGLTSRYRLPFNTTFGAGVTFDNTHFAPPVNFTLTNANYDIETGDLNLDGKPDVLAESNGGFAFRNTHTTGAISASSLIPDDTLSVNSFINPRLEDFDGDGLLDVVSVNGLLHKNSSTTSEISHMPAVTIGLGASTLDMSDFNNDGKLDIAVTTDLSGTGDLVVLENRSVTSSSNFTNGTYGTFSPNIIFNKPAASGGVVSEDFDGDGLADIVTTNPGSDNISLFRNLGVLKISTAQFATRVDVTVGDNPGRIYKGDFDTDGKIDLLLYHNTGTTAAMLTVMHNTSTVGDISFNRIDLTNPSATTVATISDLDGDGKPEIITTSETGNRFSIFKNIHTTGALSAASFAAPFSTTVTAPRGLATADLNLDGKPEIIITRPGLLVVYENLITTVSAVSPPTITSFTPASAPVGTTITITGTNFDPTPANNIVYFGATRATVSAATTTELIVTVPIDATYARITELNVTTNLQAYSMDNFTPTFSPGKGSITSSDFEPKVDFTTGSNPLNVSIGDLDGDGKSDLAVANTASNTISVLRNTSTGTASISYAAKVDFPSAADPESVSIGDFDGDGKADLAVPNYIGFSVSVFRNTSTGAGNISYAPKIDFATGFTHRSGAIADFDGDGKVDIVTANDNGNSVSVLRNTSTGPGNINYAAKVDFSTGAGSGPYSISVGDADGDDKPDVIAPNFNTSTVSILRNTSAGEGDISFAAKVDFTTGANPISVSVGDLDGDGKQDLAIVNKNSNTISVFRNTSTGAGNISYAAKVDFPVSNDPRSVSIGDLDGDGKADLAIANDGSNAVSVLRNISTGLGNINFASKVDFTTGTSPRYVSIGDSDGDGKSDLVVANAGGNSVSVIRNNPVLSPPATITIDTQPASMAVCEGGTGNLVFAASGTTNLTYQWQKFDGASFTNISNTGGYSGTTTSTLVINTTGNFGAGDYRCAVSGDNAATVFSQTATLSLGSNATVAEITLDGSTLTASPGDSYQWYQDGEEITGATNQTLAFNVLEYGVFTVAVTDNGCTALSEEFIYLITGFEKNTEGLKLYPNPVEENLFVEFKPPYQIQIMGVTGNVIQNLNIQSVTSSFDFSSMANGIYFLKIKNERQTQYLRIIKK